MAEDAGNPLAQMFGRLGLSGEQLSSLQSQLGRIMPSEQLKLMRDLVDTFSPSGDQLTAIRRQLEAQRVQVEAMLAQLEDMDATVARLADTAEQLRAMQEPFQRLTHLFSPGSDRGTTRDQ
jgi:methyl-accepting chemotaxis protein